MLGAPPPPSWSESSPTHPGVGAGSCREGSSDFEGEPDHSCFHRAVRSVPLSDSGLRPISEENAVKTGVETLPLTNV